MVPIVCILFKEGQDRDGYHVCIAKMPPFVCLSCVNCGKSLERQCLNLFVLEEEICGAIVSLVDCSLSLERHW